MRALSGIILGAVAIYVAICLVMFLKQRSLLYHPTSLGPTNTSFTVMDLPVDGAVVKVSLREQDGSNALIYFGGNAENVALNLPDFASSFPNYAVYLLHYRGYSGSSGRPTEVALHADAKALFEWVKLRHARVTVVGRSLGSGVAVRIAATNDVHHLVLVTPYDSIVNIAKYRYPWLPVELLLKDRFDSVRYAPQITAETVIVAAEHDQVIPRARTAALHAAFAPGVSTFELVPETDHNSIASISNYYELMGIK